MSRMRYVCVCVCVYVGSIAYLYIASLFCQSQMVLKVQRSISSRDCSVVLNLAARYLRLLIIDLLDVEVLAGNEYLRHAKRTERKGIAELVGCGTVDLACHNTSIVTDSLLGSDRSSTSVVRRDVYIQPCEIQSGSIVDCDRTEERPEELYAV